MTSRRVITITQGDSEIGSVPYPQAAAGDTAIAQVRSWAGTPNALANLICEIDAVNKEIVLSIDPVFSALLKRNCYWDVKVKTATGIRRTVAFGPAVIRAQVSVIANGLTWADWNTLTYDKWNQTSYSDYGAA